MRTPPIVLVEWDDAWSDRVRVQGDNPHYRKGYPAAVSGFLQDEEDRVVVCRAWSAGHDDEEPHFSDCVSIPRSIVTRIRQVRTWQDHQLPTIGAEKPVRRRRRKKSAPTPTPKPTSAKEPLTGSDQEGPAPSAGDEGP